VRYRHPGGVYSFPIPDGWFVLRGRRNRVVDDKFDTVIHPDGREMMIVLRASVSAPQGESTLRTYEADKWSEANRIDQARRERLILAGMPAFRVTYRSPDTPESISRVAFVHERQLLVINCVHATMQDGGLPMAIKQSLSQLRLDVVDHASVP
ncbi:MAG: hypothetical protein KDA60_22785, partial [Planctomycetales bacterium]|nr:hypothetical protein [Planctomycetales bacterium]